MKPFIFFGKNLPELKKYGARLFYPALLFILISTCVCTALPHNALFGSEGDWFSQHAAIAEQYRAAFYETGNIFPDWLPLGSGSNSYDFSYYGFLRPDVLISFFLPGVPMTHIISCYALLGLMIGTLLCYFWLKRHAHYPFFAFLGAVLFACASCFYHARHQIMFVNYMPFLILALWGIEMLIQKGRFALLTISFFLVCIHSYYFAPAVLAVCLLYFLYFLTKEKELHFFTFIRCPDKIRNKHWFSIACKFALSITLALGMAAILLIPTGLDLLSTTKDAGNPAALSEIFSLGLDLSSLLYHPYGCGLTLLCLYTLLLSIRRKKTRILGIFLLLCLTVNTCPYLLSGLLYVRYKVLIPLVPLLLLLCVLTLEALFTDRERHSIFLGLVCLLPAIFSKYALGIAADALWLFLSFVLIDFGKRCILRKTQRHAGQTKHAPIKTALPLFLVLCIPSLYISEELMHYDDHIYCSDKRQEPYRIENQSVSDELRQNQDYRFECLTDPFATVNTTSLTKAGRTSMYSSVTNKDYADFYYNTMRNPIRIRNRVALMTDANPFFSYLMGIRYIQTDKDFLPLGYRPLADSAESAILAENSQVLPTAYTSTALMTQDEFDKLDFPFSLEALTKYTVIPSAGSRRAPPGSSVPIISKEAFMKNTQIRELSPEEFHLSDISGPQTDSKNTAQVSLPVPSYLESRLLIISVKVSSPSGKEITIDINRIRNKLSGKNAPYPNHNDTFTWIISSNQIIEQLNITLSGEDYVLSDWQIWTMDTENWGNSSIRPLQKNKDSEALPYDHKSSGTVLLHKQAVLDKPGYFATSFPYRNGYKAYVNGKETDISLVNQTFIGIPLETGTYEITLTYRPPGKVISGWISLLSLLLFLLWELHVIYRNNLSAARKIHSTEKGDYYEKDT